MRVLLASIFLLSACATGQSPAPSTLLEEISARSYDVGVPTTTVVGDPLVRVRHYYAEQQPVSLVRANRAFRVRGGAYDIRFTKDQTLKVEQSRVEDGQRLFAVPVETSQFGMAAIVLLEVDDEGRIQRKALDGGAIFSFRADPEDGRLTPVTEKSVVKSKPFTNYEIVFNGSDGQAMRFTYREYSPDDLARTAFFQELSYPLTAKTIRFRKLLLDVLSINEQEITFVVRED